MAVAEAETAASVRQLDPDRYLAALYAPGEKRGAIFALYAFNAEISVICDRVSQPLTGEIRLQWWRDVLAGAQDNSAAAGHPTAVGLLNAIQTHRLPVEPFLNMLEARIFDLYDDPMPSRTDLEGYCGETNSALIQLCALILDPEGAQRFAAAAGHAGCAQTIAGLLRLLPLHRRRGQCYIPLDILEAAGTTRDELVSGSDEAGAERAIAAMAALGREHLNAFMKNAKALPVSLRPAYLPLALTGAYLKRSSAGAAHRSGEITAISALRKHWLLLKHAMRGW